MFSRRWTLLALVAASGCASTTLESRWVAPAAAEEKVQRVLVVGLTGSEGRRRSFEAGFTEQLKAAGIEAVPLTQLTAKTEISREELLAAVHEGKFDGVITSRLINVERDTDYVPAPPMVYGGLYDQWGAVYGVPASGYLVETTTYKVETNIYSADGKGKLIWSGVSSSVDPSSSDKAVEDVQALVIKQARKDGAL